MLPFALNHMTVPNASTFEIFDMAKSLGFVGVELRNDMSAPLFGHLSAAEVGQEAKSKGLRILALAEVYAFNDNTTETRALAFDLAQMARDCGANAVALIPRVADHPVDRATQRSRLRAALMALRPMFDDLGITALIEPLGFANSSLRLKADVLAVLEELGHPAYFALIHDTFHHALSGEDVFFADATSVVHISGVSDPFVASGDIVDVHRGLVGANDRLGNLDQIAALCAQGYAGSFSFEAFAPEIHYMTDPASALSASIDFINSQVANLAA